MLDSGNTEKKSDFAGRKSLRILQQQVARKQLVRRPSAASAAEQQASHSTSMELLVQSSARTNRDIWLNANSYQLLTPGCARGNRTNAMKGSI